ncbi:hypothetical protein FOXYSP1_03748 [Fusarium oxysporum f. sp. phaseoli]
MLAKRCRGYPDPCKLPCYEYKPQRSPVILSHCGSLVLFSRK